MRSCFDCAHCKCHIVLKPLHPRRRKIKHPINVVADKLNSKLIFTHVYCKEGMWETEDGKPVRYESFYRLMKNPLPKRFETAEFCNRYTI